MSRIADSMPIARHRADARSLLKQLRSPHQADAALAAERFRGLRSFADQSVDRILADRQRVQLKHALAVIASEHHFESWVALKTALEAERRTQVAEPGSADHDDGAWYDPSVAVFLNRWFARYEDALRALHKDGGFLLPYRHHFFLCQEDVIRALGLDPADPDWGRIGHDGARPADPQAWKRLCERRSAARRPERTPTVSDGRSGT